MSCVEWQIQQYHAVRDRFVWLITGSITPNSFLHRSSITVMLGGRVGGGDLLTGKRVIAGFYSKVESPTYSTSN